MPCKIFQVQITKICGSATGTSSTVGLISTFVLNLKKEKKRKEAKISSIHIDFNYFNFYL